MPVNSSQLCYNDIDEGGISDAVLVGIILGTFFFLLAAILIIYSLCKKSSNKKAGQAKKKQRSSPRPAQNT